MGRDPNANERQSIANAIQLIREANYKEKANFLDDLLQDSDFDVNDLPGGTTAEARRVIFIIQWSEEITLDPRVIPPGRVIRRNDPEIAELAGTILHEGTHLQCHDELAAWGTELAFYRTLENNKGTLFKDVDEGARHAINRLLDVLIREAEMTREYIARRGGHGYGDSRQRITFIGGRRFSEMDLHKLAQNPDASPFGQVPVELRYPQDPTEPVDSHLFGIGNAIWEHWKRTGTFPASPNLNMVKVLKKCGVYHFAKEELDQKGEVIDQWGHPYIYRCPGKIFRDFDLYSAGPNGRDEEGGGDDVLYITRRK